MPAGEGALFALASVSVGTREARRLDRLDARLPADGLTVVAGPSGSRKSTLLRLCNRLEVAGGDGSPPGRGHRPARPLTLRREVAMVFRTR